MERAGMEAFTRPGKQGSAVSQGCVRRQAETVAVPKAARDCGEPAMFVWSGVDFVAADGL